MRKLTAILVALGFLGATSLPTFAATATSGVTTLSAQAQQTDTAKKPAKKMKKKSTKKTTKKAKKPKKKSTKKMKKTDEKKP